MEADALLVVAGGFFAQQLPEQGIPEKMNSGLGQTNHESPKVRNHEMNSISIFRTFVIS
jgi:hypothetical protein